MGGPHGRDARGQPRSPGAPPGPSRHKAHPAAGQSRGSIRTHRQPRGRSLPPARCHQLLSVMADSRTPGSMALRDGHF
eukprot:4680152-Pyramimonas_sp.AAC.1